MGTYVTLDRQFSPVSKDQEEAESEEILTLWGHVKPKTWDELEYEYRSVILAEAGAGKTEELRQRARLIAERGRFSFFIRIEDIETAFWNAFEVGEQSEFDSWVQSTEEAWFFLDSVDEARLDNPRAFDQALRRFAKGIKAGAHRAHIYLSSRPYAWRPQEDRRLLDEILFLAAPPSNENNGEGETSSPPSALTLYTLKPLDDDRVRRFCEARSAPDIDRLMQEIERANLWNLAERPFDLEGILAKWNEDQALGGRLELLRHNIDKCLRDDHNSNRAQRQPLNLEQARRGARRLAAAVVLTGKAGLNVPDGVPTKPGIDAETVLSDWDPKDVRALLERGIFNDVIYGAVRFRHRDVRELLAAEWFDELLKAGNSRHAVEALILREQYGETIITPRLRPILPWLVLLDDDIRQKALSIHPEIAVEGGDPARLPLSERQAILASIVQRIVSDLDDHGARDNSAISRIAQKDLVQDTLRLINAFNTNEDAIFFLGRLVWQGEMGVCVAPLVAIAADESRGKYARIASARAVMTCGSDEQRRDLWHQLNANDALILRDVLAEMVESATPSSESVDQLITALDKLPPYRRHEGTGLGRALHGFVERLPAGDGGGAISKLLDGLHGYLIRSPHIERRECHVSEAFAWLMSPATHAVEKLVAERNAAALGPTALSIMQMVPALRFWRGDDFSEHKGKLRSLVPAWPELNDALYWASIERARAARVEKSRELLTDDYAVSWLGHFWAFDQGDFGRLLDFIRTCPLQDDRLVALSTAFRVYVAADRPAILLADLQGAIGDDLALKERLGNLLNPPVSEAMRAHEEKMANFQQERDEKEEQEKRARDEWIMELRADPGRVRKPKGLKPGDWTNDQCWLLHEVQGSGLTTTRADGANWQALVPEFGEDVAHAYRDAAISHWRHYLPPLKSEGDQSTGTPYSLIFAMAGLEMEATEVSEFPKHLDESQVRHALRYITWELNGFPSWLERMYKAFPSLVEVAVLQELQWELAHTDPEKPLHHILHDLVYYAPWIHAAVAPELLKWMEGNPNRIGDNRQHCLHILVNGGIDPARLADLARKQVEQSNGADDIAGWYALYVDCEPESGIPKLEQWLATLTEEAAMQAAQTFITTLMGGRHGERGGPNAGHFRTAEHLKALYVLMHRHIRAKDDIDRAGKGVYSPGPRDDAQDARNRLFGLLSEIPGKASYSAIKELIEDHPDPNYRPWMAKRAYQRAEQDGDLEAWTAEQVCAFHVSQTLIPLTHRQLFDLAVGRLLDLKNWLERGNDSPWQTWQRAAGETEMRTLVAGWLNQRCRDQYTTAQEPELANSQRMDIWLHNTNVTSPVPIELKLLDKDWTGPGLCERLRNQLAGDYLREESAGCGVMLLVWQGKQTGKRWEINGQREDVSNLAGALKRYWQSIANDFAGIQAIDVIVIDLAIRGETSNS